MQNTEFRTGVIKPVEVYKEAWELIKDQYWIIFAVVLVGLLIGGAVPIVLVGPMVCGIYLVLFNKFEGKEVDFGLLFKGFDYFLPSLILAVIVTVPTLIMVFAIYIPMVGIAMAGPRMGETELIAFIAVTIVIELIFAVILVCIHTLLMFAFPLIVDKKLPVLQAMKTSARAVWANMGGVVGMFAVGFVVCIVGYMLLCVGIYLVIPLVIAANALAYRKVFPAGGVDFNSPQYYQGV